MTTLSAKDFQWEEVGTIGWSKTAHTGHPLFSQPIKATVTLIGGVPMAHVSGRGRTKFLLTAATVAASKAWASREFNRRLSEYLAR
jgi:hypothetical protein